MHFSHAVVLKKDTRVRIYIGPWVLGFALFEKDVWDNFVDLSDQFEHRVVGKMFQSKFSLARVPGIGLPEDGVSVTGNDASRFQSVPDEFPELIVRYFTTQIFLKFSQPYQYFLV